MIHDELEGQAGALSATIRWGPGRLMGEPGLRGDRGMNDDADERTRDAFAYAMRRLGEAVDVIGRAMRP